MIQHDDDPDLHDEELEADIELLAEVIDHVADHSGHLTGREIDEALGVHLAQRGPLDEAAATHVPMAEDDHDEPEGRLYA